MEGEDEIQEQEKQQQVSPSPSLDSKPQSSLQKLKIAAEDIDIHIMVIPPLSWRRDLRYAYSVVCFQSISAGFVRVPVETSLIDSRYYISKQLNGHLVPAQYVLLRKVGRYLTMVNEKQEQDFAINIYAPPMALHPELYILDQEYLTNDGFSDALIENLCSSDLTIHSNLMQLEQEEEEELRARLTKGNSLVPFLKKQSFNETDTPLQVSKQPSTKPRANEETAELAEQPSSFEEEEQKQQPQNKQPGSSTKQQGDEQAHSKVVKRQSPSNQQSVSPAVPDTPKQPSNDEPSGTQSSKIKAPKTEPSSSKNEAPKIEPSSSKIEPSKIEPSSSKNEAPKIEPSSSKIEPSKIEPSSSKIEPSKIEPSSSKNEAPKIEPSSSKIEPSKIEPSSSKIEPSKIEPSSSKIEPSKIEPLSSKIETPKIKPSNIQPSKIEPSKIELSSSKIETPKIEPSNIQPSKIEPLEILPSNIQSSNIQSPNIQSSNIDTSKILQSSNNQPLSNQSSNIQPSLVTNPQTTAQENPPCPSSSLPVSSSFDPLQAKMQAPPMPPSSSLASPQQTTQSMPFNPPPNVQASTPTQTLPAAAPTQLPQQPYNAAPNNTIQPHSFNPPQNMQAASFAASSAQNPQSLPLPTNTINGAPFTPQDMPFNQASNTPFDSTQANSTFNNPVQSFQGGNAFNAQPQVSLESSFTPQQQPSFAQAPPQAAPYNNNNMAMHQNIPQVQQPTFPSPAPSFNQTQPNMPFVPGPQNPSQPTLMNAQFSTNPNTITHQSLPVNAATPYASQGFQESPQSTFSAQNVQQPFGGGGMVGVAQPSLNAMPNSQGMPFAAAQNAPPSNYPVPAQSLPFNQSNSFQNPQTHTQSSIHSIQTPFPNPQSSFPNPQSSFPNSQSSFSNPQSSFPNPQSSFPNPQPSFPNPQSSFPNPQSSFPNPQSSFPNPQSSFPNPQSSFPNPQSSFPNPQSLFQQPLIQNPQAPSFQNPQQPLHIAGGPQAQSLPIHVQQNNPLANPQLNSIPQNPQNIPFIGSNPQAAVTMGGSAQPSFPFNNVPNPMQGSGAGFSQNISGVPQVAAPLGSEVVPNFFPQDPVIQQGGFRQGPSSFISSDNANTQHLSSSDYLKNSHGLGTAEFSLTGGNTQTSVSKAVGDNRVAPATSMGNEMLNQQHLLNGGKPLSPSLTPTLNNTSIITDTIADTQKLGISDEADSPSTLNIPVSIGGPSSARPLGTNEIPSILSSQDIASSPVPIGDGGQTSSINVATFQNPLQAAGGDLTASTTLISGREGGQGSSLLNAPGLQNASSYLSVSGVEAAPLSSSSLSERKEFSDDSVLLQDRAKVCDEIAKVKEECDTLSSLKSSLTIKLRDTNLTIQNLKKSSDRRWRELYFQEKQTLTKLEDQLSNISKLRTVDSSGGRPQHEDNTPCFVTTRKGWMIYRAGEPSEIANLKIQCWRVQDIVKDLRERLKQTKQMLAKEKRLRQSALERQRKLKQELVNQQIQLSLKSRLHNPLKNIAAR